jgi:putative endonuclease
LQEHNFSERITYTSKHRPWALKAVFSCGEVDAMQVENFVKKQKSRKLIERLITGNIFTGVLAQRVSVAHVRD